MGKRRCFSLLKLVDKCSECELGELRLTHQVERKHLTLEMTISNFKGIQLARESGFKSQIVSLSQFLKSQCLCDILFDL